MCRRHNSKKAVAIFTRNINQPRLCNGSRLEAMKLEDSVFEATILKGQYNGEDVSISRVPPLIPIHNPFDFKRLRFPVRFAFAMSVNQSQGQSLSVRDVNLENPLFSYNTSPVHVSENHQPRSTAIDKIVTSEMWINCAHSYCNFKYKLMKYIIWLTRQCLAIAKRFRVNQFHNDIMYFKRTEQIKWRGGVGRNKRKKL